MTSKCSTFVMLQIQRNLRMEKAPASNALQLLDASYIFIYDASATWGHVLRHVKTCKNGVPCFGIMRRTCQCMSWVFSSYDASESAIEFQNSILSWRASAMSSEWNLKGCKKHQPSVDMICICMDHKWFTWDDQGLWRTHREEWWERWPNQGPTEPGGQCHGVARCSVSALSPRSLHCFWPIPVVSESREKLLERLCTNHHGIWWHYMQSLQNLR